jgi:hypothetical protein
MKLRQVPLKEMPEDLKRLLMEDEKKAASYK